MPGPLIGFWKTDIPMSADETPAGMTIINLTGIATSESDRRQIDVVPCFLFYFSRSFIIDPKQRLRNL